MDSNEPDQDAYNIGGLIVTKAELLAWSDSLQGHVGGLNIGLIEASIATATDQAMGQDGLSDRQIHELRGGYMVLRNVLNTLRKVVYEADAIRKADAEKAHDVK